MHAFEKAPPDVKEILAKPIKELGLKVEGSPLEHYVQRLHRELDRKGLKRFHPGCYLTDEWGCPSGQPVIGIPFYLANPKLARLEKEMNDLEDEREIMMYLRHEAGHAFNYAYRLYETPEWRELFGPFRRAYRESYRPVPFSKRFVRHIDGWYAWAHPDEDFAETFAVWLTPRSNWRGVYKNWPAIKKLEYVHRLMVKIRRRKPKVLAGPLHSPYQSKTYTLIEYYGEDLDNFKDKALGIYDDDLNMIFDHYTNGFRKTISAKDLIRRNRRFLITTIATWTGAREKVVAPVINKFFQRCRELGLHIPAEEESARLASLTALGTAVVMNYLHT